MRDALFTLIDKIIFVVSSLRLFLVGVWTALIRLKSLSVWALEFGNANTCWKCAGGAHAMDGRGFGCGSRHFSKIANLEGLRKHFRHEIQHGSLTILIHKQ